MPRSDGRESSSRRSRSRHRSRSHRDHHGHRHRSRSRRPKYNEKNYMAAIFNMLSIVFLCTALVEPKWLYLTGGGCSANNVPLHYLGASQFFYPGKVSEEKTFAHTEGTTVVYAFGGRNIDRMYNCVGNKATLLFKVIISFCIVAIVCSLCAFILDLMAMKNKAAKMLRRNAVFSIITVMFSVIINLFCYWVATEVEQLQTSTKLHVGSHVAVDFDISFYLITAAGGLSVLATAFSCLRRYPMYEDSQGTPLMDDYDGMESLIAPPVPEPVVPAQISGLPPPPAYTP